MKAPTENSREGVGGVAKGNPSSYASNQSVDEGSVKNISSLGFSGGRSRFYYRGRPFVYGVHGAMYTPQFLDRFTSNITDPRWLQIWLTVIDVTDSAIRVED